MTEKEKLAKAKAAHRWWLDNCVVCHDDSNYLVALPHNKFMVGTGFSVVTRKFKTEEDMECLGQAFEYFNALDKKGKTMYNIGKFGDLLAYRS